jgi:hypothetical protein
VHWQSDALTTRLDLIRTLDLIWMRSSLRTLESCYVQNFDNQVKAVVGAHMKEYRNKWLTTAGESQLG